MEIESSKVQEEEKVEETDQKMESADEDGVPEPMKPDEKLEHISGKEEVNVNSFSALDMIFKSLWYISVFKQELAKIRVPDASPRKPILQPLKQLLFMYGTEGIVDELNQDIYDALLDDLMIAILQVTHPEINTICEFWLFITRLLYYWNSEGGTKRLDFHFKMNEAAVNMICDRCQKETDHPFDRSYGLIISAYELRETKSALEEISFERILKVTRIILKIPCDGNSGRCGKQNYVPRIIDRLPSVFPFVLEWEYNETEDEISATASILTPEIDISEIYQYHGVSSLTKYQLVSMICLVGEQYNCIAYANGSWLRHFRSVKEDCLDEIEHTSGASKEKTWIHKKEVIGDWQNVLNCIRNLKIRPEILLFENVASDKLPQCEEQGSGRVASI